MRERSPEASPTSNPGIRAEIGFNLQISNQTQVQFAFGQFASSTQNASNAKLKPVSPGHPAVKSPISVQDDYRIEADEPVQTDKPIGKIELVAKTELIEERDVGRAIALPALLAIRLFILSKRFKLLLSKQRLSLQVSLTNPSITLMVPLNGKSPLPSFSILGAA
ncbi:MAG: hypothetical protein HC899_20010 [Leptolyngbyaceae cyanobacterium SM1_4_3]|nr:hypothetical protein [Leptolyngbyaceae cyanobacterium SM1_4_3]